MTMPMTFGAGMSNAQPDVCKTPPFAIPVPYPNVAPNATVVPGYFTVMILSQPELNIMSQYPVTQGDQAGVMGGVVSSTIMGPGRPMMGSMVCFIGGSPTWLLTKPTLHNTTNAPGVTAVPSQTCKMVLR